MNEGLAAFVHEVQGGDAVGQAGEAAVSIVVVTFGVREMIGVGIQLGCRALQPESIADLISADFVALSAGGVPGEDHQTTGEVRGEHARGGEAVLPSDQHAQRCRVHQLFTASSRLG